jgi:hypothetical protein
MEHDLTLLLIHALHPVESPHVNRDLCAFTLLSLPTSAYHYLQ